MRSRNRQHMPVPAKNRCIAWNSERCQRVSYRGQSPRTILQVKSLRGKDVGSSTKAIPSTRTRINDDTRYTSIRRDTNGSSLEPGSFSCEIIDAIIISLCADYWAIPLRLGENGLHVVIRHANSLFSDRFLAPSSILFSRPELVHKKLSMRKRPNTPISNNVSSTAILSINF